MFLIVPNDLPMKHELKFRSEKHLFVKWIQHGSRVLLDRLSRPGIADVYWRRRLLWVDTALSCWKPGFCHHYPNAAVWAKIAIDWHPIFDLCSRTRGQGVSILWNKLLRSEAIVKPDALSWGDAGRQFPITKETKAPHLNGKIAEIPIWIGWILKDQIRQ